MIGETSHKGKGLTVLIFTLTGLITVFSWRYMIRQLAVVKQQVVYRRRKERFVVFLLFYDRVFRFLWFTYELLS